MTTQLNFIAGAITHTEGFDWGNIMLAALNDGTLQESPGAHSVLHITAGDGSTLILTGTFDVISSTAVTGPLTSFEVWKGSQQVMTASFTHSVSVESVGAVSGDATIEDLIQALQVIYGNESVTSTGSPQTDQIFGGAANDTLSGGDAGDLLTGFAGEDYLDGGSDGWDDVRYNRELGTQGVVVNLNSSDRISGGTTLAGHTAIDTYGNVDTFHNINFVSGTSLDDVFFGRDGDGEFGDFPDFVSGNDGNDIFVGGTGGLGVAYDQPDLESGGGKVKVNLSTSTKYGVGAGYAVDTFGKTDTLTNIQNVALSHKNDTIYGGSASEHFWGRGGNDLMIGNKGRDNFEGDDGEDKIDGGEGKDTLSGGLNRDTLTGGKDADQFVYFSAVKSGASSTTRDYITDFKHGTDEFHLAAIDANTTKNDDQAFKLDAEGSKNSDVAKGHIGWYQIDKSGTANDRTILKFNVDSDKAIEMSIELKGLVDLTKGDFIL